jgi:hypothetical protein
MFATRLRRSFLLNKAENSREYAIVFHGQEEVGVSQAPGIRGINSRRIASWRTHESRAAIFATLSELLFILLPFVVLALVYAFGHHASRILSHPEWALASALLFGHAIIKLVCGVVKIGARNGDTLGFVVAAGIVLGLTPSLVVLVLMEIMEDTQGGPAIWLITVQVVLFVLAVIYFIIFRWVGELLERVDPNIAAVVPPVGHHE